MKKKYLLIGLLLVLFVLMFGSVPRITAQATVPFADVEGGAYPELLEEYNIQRADRIFTPLDAQVLTVSTIWGSTECMILPCIHSEVNTVPKYGNTFWMTRLCMVVSYSKPDSLTAKLCRVGAGDMHVYAVPEENTMISSSAEVYPNGSFDHESGEVQIEDVPDCAVTPAVGVTFRTATAGIATEEKESCRARFVWNFDITFLNRSIYSVRDFVVEYEYLNNA